MDKTKQGFTLAETLITLVIIGIVAAITIPVLMNKIEDRNFKVAYKKAYSDINAAFQEDITFNQFPSKNGNCYDVEFGNYTFNKLKEKFKVMKVCENNNAFDCWVEADNIDRDRPRESSKLFVDISGRAWGEFEKNRAIYLVDTNGDKKPNQFGKDRWHFSFRNYPDRDDCTINPSKPIRIQPYVFYDYKTANDWCNHPPCYYKKWLME